MHDYIVVGGGMLGVAIGYGLAKRGVSCTILDATDRDFRAATGNFGLVWVQGKGDEFPSYAKWTRESASLWPTFAQELESLTGVNVEYEKKGGVNYCFSNEELLAEQQLLEKIKQASAGDFTYRMLDNNELKEFEPSVNATIPGASYSPNDGHVNPLLLLRAMHSAFTLSGGNYLGNHSVQSIEPIDAGYKIKTANGELQCKHIILATGLDNKRLAEMLDMKQPVFAQRGQILVSERIPKILNYPSNYLRQTFDGTVLMGDSHENVGLDDGQQVEQMAKIAQRACEIIPLLKKVKIVRGWGALRILSADGYPIYERAGNAWAFSSHSGVTLAAVHAEMLVENILDNRFSADAEAFSASRFEVKHV